MTRYAIVSLGTLVIRLLTHSSRQTKEGHCSRVTQQILAQSQLPAFSDKLDVKRHYDAGEWSVPCYSLRCTSFSMLLYNALHVAAKAVQQTN